MNVPALKSSHFSTQDLEGSEKPLTHLHHARATLPSYRSTNEQLEGAIAKEAQVSKRLLHTFNTQHLVISALIHL